jgi:signal transduction histidine kinase
MARDLLDYARPAAFRLQEVSLVEVLEASLDLLKFHLRKLDVQVERRFEPGAPNVVGDRGRLRQLFLNLIVNAVHAMENAPVRKLTLGLRRSESAVVAEISDTGPGIPAALRDRIFEPFFTTKDGGKGTGLGLFIVHGIVEQHGGRVEALDGEGRGAKLRVELPAAL